MMTKTWMASLVLGTLLLGCGEATQNAGREETTTETGGKGDIYGDDNRSDAFDSRDPLMEPAVEATAVLVRPSKIEDAGNDQLQLVDETFGEEKNLCDGERFAEQIAPGHCTGFLIGPDMVATAGHCVDDPDDCSNTRFVFDFRYEDPDEDPTLIDEADVYECGALLAREHDSDAADWALVRLDRAATGRVPLAFRDAGSIEEGDLVALVGHPSGLPLKIADGGTVVDGSHDAYFKSDLDTYGGNSGSAVVNFATGVVEGIHARGTSDFVETEDGCQVSRVCEKVGGDGCGGNSATRITHFSRFIPPPLDSSGWTHHEVRGMEVGDGEVASDLTVDVDGAVDFAIVQLHVVGDREGATYIIERSDGHTVDITDYVLDRTSDRGHIAVPDFAGNLAASTYRLRIFSSNDEPPELLQWELDLHTK